MKGVRSELVVPLLLKDRCIGVFDLESPELDAFSKKHVELLTLLASQAAVAIENARLYESIRDNEVRLEKELRFAQRVQMALLPQELPKRLRGVDVAWHFDPARELGGDLCDFLSPEPNTLVVALGDVSGKGVPAALYGAFVGEMIRGRTFRRRLEKKSSTPAAVLTGMNRILHERNLEEYYCTLCYAMFEFKKKTVTFANSGLPFPVQCSNGKAVQIDLPGVPLGSFGGSTYEDAGAARGRRRVRVLLGRHLRGVRRGRPGIRRRARDRGGRAELHACRRRRSSARCSRAVQDFAETPSSPTIRPWWS